MYKPEGDGLGACKPTRQDGAAAAQYIDIGLVEAPPAEGVTRARTANTGADWTEVHATGKS